MLPQSLPPTSDHGNLSTTAAEDASRLLKGAITYAEDTVGVELLLPPSIRGKGSPVLRTSTDFDGETWSDPVSPRLC